MEGLEADHERNTDALAEADGGDDGGANFPESDDDAGPEVASCRIDDGDVTVCLEWTGPTARPIARITCDLNERGSTYVLSDDLCTRDGAMGSCTMLNQTELFYDSASADENRQTCSRVHGGVWKDL